MSKQTITGYKTDEFFEILIRNGLSMEVKDDITEASIVTPDDDLDFHAYRLLLLIYKCGTVKGLVSPNYMLYGRRKFAFYDFLIRYPFYLEKCIQISGKDRLLLTLDLKSYEKSEVFSPMINYIRGPWDPRYDGIFGYMVSKRLLEVTFTKITPSSQNMFCVILTELGMEIARKIELLEPDWVRRMEIVTTLFPRNTTNKRVEEYIYEHFPELILGGA